jgi:hypothetical protein
MDAEAGSRGTDDYATTTPIDATKIRFGINNLGSVVRNVHDRARAVHLIDQAYKCAVALTAWLDGTPMAHVTSPARLAYSFSRTITISISSSASWPGKKS